MEFFVCPDCGQEMKKCKSKYGYFLGCKNYPNCKGTRNLKGQSKTEEKTYQEFFGKIPKIIL